MSSTAEHHASWHRGRRIYLFAAAALAVFVFVLAVSRMQSGQMQATASMARMVPTGVQGQGAMRQVACIGGDLEQVRRALADEELLAEAAEGLLLFDPTADVPVPLSALSDQLSLELVPPGREGAETTLAVTFRHRDGATATQFVNRLTKTYAARELKAAEAIQYRNPYEEAKRAAADAQQARDAAQTELQQFLERFAAELERGQQTEQAAAAEMPVASEVAPRTVDRYADWHGVEATDRAAAGLGAAGPELHDPALVGDRYAAPSLATPEDAVPPVEETPQSPTIARNPAEVEARAELARLDRDLAELERIRVDLLSRLTPQHPMVVEMSGRIEGLRTDMEQARVRLAAAMEEAATAAEVAGATDPDPAEAAIDSARREELLAERSRLERRAAAASANYDRLAAIERNRWMKQLDEVRVPRWDVRPADRATMAHESTSPGMVLLAAALALAAGGGLFAAATISSAGFQSVAEAEAALPVPIVGRLPSTGPAAGKPGLRRAVRWTVLVCEIGLATFLLAMILSVLLDGDFAATLKKDPLAALADGWRHLWSLINR